MSDIEKYLNKTLSDANFKAVVGRLLTMTLYYNQQTDEPKRLKICKEAFSTVPVVIYYQKNFWFTDAINEKIEILKSAGLIEFWYLKYIDKGMKDIVDKRPKVLRLEHFQGSFVLLSCGFVISLMVLIIEKVCESFRKFQ